MFGTLQGLRRFNSNVVVAPLTYAGGIFAKLNFVTSTARPVATGEF